MRLLFDTGRPRPGESAKRPETMKLLVKTKRLGFIEKEDLGNGRFNVAYELHAEGSLLGTYEITITYSEGIK